MQARFKVTSSREEPEVVGHASRQSCVLIIGLAAHGIVGSRNS